MDKVLLYITAASVLCAVSTVAKIQYHFIYEQKNWNDAQSYCRTKYTDLVTVSSAETTSILRNMVDMKKATEAWIGLHVGVKGWSWSNGSQVTYTNWGSSEPNGPTENCAAVIFQSSGRWADLYCSYAKAFICYHEVPFTKQVMKLKLVVNSALDLKAAVVQEGLLNEMRKKLKEQGVSADVRLSWKKQRDGNIFQREK